MKFIRDYSGNLFSPDCFAKIYKHTEHIYHKDGTLSRVAGFDILGDLKNSQSPPILLFRVVYGGSFCREGRETYDKCEEIRNKQFEKLKKSLDVFEFKGDD